MGGVARCSMLRELVKTSSRTNLVESGLLGDARRGRATTPRLLASSARHESLHHSPKTALNVLRCHLGLQPRFCWNQFTQPTKQHPQRDFDRSAVSFVHLELGRGKTTRTRSLPSPLTGVQEPLNNRRQQTILCGLTGRFSNAPFDHCEFIVFRCCRSHSAPVSLPATRTQILCAGLNGSSLANAYQRRRICKVTHTCRPVEYLSKPAFAPFVNRLSRDSEQLRDLAVRVGFANSIITALQPVTLLNSLHAHWLRRISNPLIISSGAAPDDLAPPDPGSSQSHRLIDEASKRGVVARPRRASPSSPDSTRLVRLEVLTSSLSVLHLPC